MTSRKRWLRAAVGLVVLAALGVALAAFVTTPSTASTPQRVVASQGKVFVCKYVGKPGVDERLQTGQNPISVSVNAIPEDPVVIGSFFADAQGRSFVLAFDTGQPEPPISACPAPEGPPTTSTTTTTTSTTTTTPSTSTTTPSTSTSTPSTSTSSSSTSTSAPTTTSESSSTSTSAAPPPDSAPPPVTKPKLKQQLKQQAARPGTGRASGPNQAGQLANTGLDLKDRIAIGIALLLGGLMLRIFTADRTRRLLRLRG